MNLKKKKKKEEKEEKAPDLFIAQNTATIAVGSATSLDYEYNRYHLLLLRSKNPGPFIMQVTIPEIGILE